MDIRVLLQLILATIVFTSADSQNCSCCENCTTTTATSTTAPEVLLLSCGSGEFYNSTLCQKCPVGHFCPSFNTSTPCNDGFYANATGQSECSPCPAGYECKKLTTSGSISPVACDPGFYSRQGEAQCTPCPSGFYANVSMSSSCKPCPIGHKCPSADTNPTPCPGGYIAQHERSTSCLPCMSGYYRNNTDGAQACQPCPVGHECTIEATINPVACQPGHFAGSTASQCMTCSDGFYAASSAASTCVPCLSGHQCSNATVLPIQCQPGTYAPSMSLVCYACPSGFYANDTSQSECQLCPAGFECSNPSEPTICAAGSVSLARAIHCTKCIDGLTYSSQPGQSACLECPSGHICSNSSQEPTNVCLAGWYLSNGTVCHQCSPGWFSNSGAKSCSPCPAGSYCPEFSSTTYLDCLPGTFSIEGSSNCTQCPDGSYQNQSNSNSCISCPVGFQCPHPTNLPIECKNGSYSPQGATSCTNCPDGTYQNLSGQGNCTECPSGHSCSGLGSSEPIPCTNGTFALSGPSDCEICPMGHYSAPNASTCLICPAGHYCSQPNLDPTPCPEGNFAASQGLTGCVQCAEGSYTSSNGSTECQNCPIGYECSFGSSFPVACWAGTYSDIEGLGECKQCAIGTYNTEMNETQCYPCPAGYSCDQRNVPPDICPTGTASGLGVQACVGCSTGHYASVNGSEICQVCPKDHTCESPKVDPVPCPQGLFSPPGSTVCSAAAPGTYYDNSTGTTIPCPDGTYYIASGSGCSDCPKGFYCLGSSADPVACVNGTYQDELAQQKCKSCPAGFSCLDITTSPVSCSDGQFSAEYQTTCTPCQTGSYSTAGSSTCTQCPAGSQCSGGAPPTNCPSGSYSNMGHGICTSCSNGTHTNGATGAMVCSTCPAGSQCSDPTASPVPCSDGEYSTDGAIMCSSCPAGSYCPDLINVKACPAGTYSLGSEKDSCLDCPAGQSCSDPSVAPNNCGEGFYSKVGHSACRECPAGSSCADPAVDPVTCGIGEFSAAGNGTCYPCPVGYACASPSSAPLKCAYGSTTEGMTGQTSCLPCPAGMICQDAQDLPFSCGNGTYAPAGSSQCISCPQGVSCNGSVATPCESGTYSLVGESVCTGCDPGFACPYTHQAVVIQCQNGTYSTGNQSSCTPCPAGVACQSTTSSASTPCPDGYFSFGGQDECTICPAGQACQTADGSSNEYCLAGTYSVAGEKICKSCSAGFACPFTNSNQTIECGNGTYSGSGQTSCSKCAPGYACPTPDADDGGKTACLPGTYSSGGQTECTACEPGYACPVPFATYVIRCPAGTYSEADSASCTDCPAGKECPTPTNATDCLDGFYSLIRQTHCTECPAGYQCADSATLPVTCLAGTYSLAAAIICEDCDPGYICDIASSSKQPLSGICPLGYYCDTATSPATPCPAGTYGPKAGLNQSTDCLDCPPGFFCGEHTEGYPGVANLCPRGAYCMEKTETASENPCPPGTYNPNIGQANSSACWPCPAGRSCPPGSSKSGTPCVAGHFCEEQTGRLEDSNPPTPCPNGTYSAEEGARTQDTCADCPAGYYCGEGTANPIPCEAGTYQPDARQVDVASCQSCTAGQVCTTTGLTQPDKPCEPGHFCPLGSSSATANPCPAGRYTDQFNLTAASECDICPERFACLAGTGGTNLAPRPCDPGYYCKNETQSPTQWPCPAGSYSNKTNLAYLDECWECPKGYYCVNGSSEPQGPCPAGYYCPPGTEFATQNPCLAGSFTNATGNVREEDCANCIAGFYCGEASSDPEPCPPGKFNGNLNSQSEYDCTDCTSGYYCPLEGTSTPVACGKGFYSGYGQANCTICDPGYYCDEDTTTAAVLQNKTCPPGMHCPAGTEQAPNLYNSSCPAGFFCVRGNLAAFPQPCPIGTFSAKTGLRNSSECEPCTEGFYCDVTNLTSTAGTCPAGHFCPEGTGSSTSNPCRPGTYLDGTAAISVDSCVDCPSGNYCPDWGTAVPTICERGHYCTPGMSNQTECQPGTFGNSTGIKTSAECTPCTGGWYCQGRGNAVPTAPCQAGYYCVSGSDTATPNGSVGNICFEGGYCPEGTAYPISCGPGKLSLNKGVQSEANCTDCPVGKFCSGDSASGVTGNCSAGYYCTGGASTPTQHSTQAGYYSEEGAYDETLCECGTYTKGNHSSSCDPCPAGQYCPAKGTSVPTICPTGHYCAIGSKNPEPCRAGTFNDEVSRVSINDCNLCEEGYYCSESGQNASVTPCKAGFWCGPGSITGTPNGTEANGGPCTAGHYCPENTASPIPCPIGYYNNQTGAQGENNCTSCDPGRVCSTIGLLEPNGYCRAGFYCAGNASSNTPTVDNPWGNPCDAGYYCPEGSGAQTLCEPGSYNTAPQNDTCLDCPPGSQCLGGTHHTVCPLGFFCPAGTGEIPESCPSGKYGHVTGLSNASQCEECPAGLYCDEFNLTTPHKECAAGYFCRSGVNVQNPGTANSTGDGGLCPTGSYCPANTGEPEPCPPGTFNNQTKREKEADCEACPAGKVCSTWKLEYPDGICAPGFYCSGGANTSTPTGGYGGYLCPIGKHCPAGTTIPLNCSAGSYSNEEGLANCTTCEAGFYCPDGTQDYNAYPCPAGYFCPAGTSDYMVNPCPAGFYSNVEGRKSADECLECDSGKFCAGDGTPGPSGDCEAGFYCLTRSPTSRPTGYGNYTSVSECLCPANETGGICPIGHYCTAGTGRPQPCDGGSFCNTTSLSAVSGPCDPGFFCTSGATRPDPPGDVTGGRCPPGKYCPGGSTSGKDCPAGTYNEGFGASLPGDCEPCTAGFFCPNVSQSSYTDECPAGFYCPAGQSLGTELPCNPGYMCPLGSPNQTLCESGYYQDDSQQENCKLCPEGYYCNQADGPITSGTAFSCPLGSYCPNGTKLADQYLCQPGTYGTRLNAQTPDDCESCPKGKYCPNYGMVNATLLDCAAGFYCLGGANVSDPTDGVTGRACSKGRYCVEGATEESLCPEGTFNNVTEIGRMEDCADCTPGWFCQTTGLVEPTGKCSARYYCPGKNVFPSSPEFNCTVGHFCPEGEGAPLPCPDGFYNTDTLQEACLSCPAGKYCVDGLNVESCPKGFYCPIETGYDWRPCELGTYGVTSNAKTADECAACDPGNFCDKLNATSVSGVCDATYFCRNGSSSRTPDGTDGVNGKCSAGYYCPSGTTSETACAPGTYRNTTGGGKQADCDFCPPGKYCSGGLAAPDGDCAGGYYCTNGSSSDKPSLGSGGAPCPTGFQCPAGSAHPESCPAGTYNNLDMRESCFECQAGYYCPANSSTYTSFNCPMGYYCPNGTKGEFDHPCPPGTFGNITNAQDLRDCYPCTSGHFCNDSGLTEPSGVCQAGYYCTLCSHTATPSSAIISPAVETSCLCPSRDNVNATGGLCQPGFFCPEGSSEPRICSPGSYCETAGLQNSPTAPCAAGFYCTQGAITHSPTDNITGNECPVGHYCPLGTSQPFICEPGSFSGHVQNKAQSDCTQCTAGSYCNGGEATTTDLCDVGYYCPEGQNTSSPSGFECPAGSSCIRGSPEPKPCESGFYQSLSTQGFCEPCPSGYYCEAINETGIIVGVVTPTECPQGFFCPNQTRYRSEFGCRRGMYGTRTKFANESQCTPCDGGKFCNTSGLSEPSGDCFAGYYCLEYAVSPTPENGTTGGPCPAGSYCLAGDPVIHDCPPGTYNPSPRGESAAACLTCPGGEFCDAPGLWQTSGNCTAGYYCPNGSVSDTEIGCPEGYHCPVGSSDPLPCLGGSYTNAAFMESCTLCLAGSFCNGTNTETCPTGYYCEAGRESPVACPRGTYNDQLGITSLQECKPCDPGFYCQDEHASNTTGLCDPGYYCRNASETREPPLGAAGDAGPCPSGHHCGLGTGEPNECPPGTFNSQEKATGAEFCENCTSGSYCNSSGLSEPTGPCSEGYYCIVGESMASPSLVTSTGGPCPAGSFCPQNASLATPCPGGTYAPYDAMPACLTCPPGHYCPIGAVNSTICSVGHFCEEGSEMEQPCSNGTFNNQTGSNSSDACQYCTAGFYCPERGMKEPRGECAEGWFCRGGSWMEKPSFVGFNDSTSCSCPAGDEVGGRCQPGQYCPRGSAGPIECDGGFFCQVAELANVSAKCDPGHFCQLGSPEPNPIGKSYGGVCPAGSYCPEGSQTPTKCPNGTFSGNTSNTKESDCEKCTEGWYCPTPGLTTPPSLCNPGCYCATGSSEACPAICRKGSQCPEGSPSEVPCPSGTFQAEPQKNNCTICPAGSYCDQLDGISDGYQGVVTPLPCPPGFFCPVETKSATEHPCPPGKYSNSPGLVAEEFCDSCDAGFYCDSFNQTAPTSTCMTGYYCPSGSTNATAVICPPGSYCSPSFAEPQACPVGTYNPVSGRGNESECKGCDPGSYCDTANLTEPRGVCSAGHYCTGRSEESNPVGKAYGDVCPAGAYCPSNSSTWIDCPSGSYNPSTNKMSPADCLACDGGSFCNGTGLDAVSGPCLEGYYCDGNASTPTQNECPEGNHCPSESPAPLPCLNGTYTNETKSKECLPCPAGWFCVNSEVNPQPCPMGHYCVEGTGENWAKCKQGTFNPTYGISSQAECTECTAGSYCATPGEANVTAPCSPGWDCVIGVDTGTPDNTSNTGSGGVCQPGFQCPNGRAELCPPGTFSDSTETKSCQPCTGGFYCTGGTITPEECPSGYYCPIGTTARYEFPCPAGTFNNKTGQANLANCLSCTPGMYCEGVGNFMETGDCEPGYYCLGGSPSKTPVVYGTNSSTGSNGTCSELFDCVCPVLDDTVGGLCPPGYFCPLRSEKPWPCTKGQYCPRAGMSSTDGNCTAGYFCNGTSTSSTQEVCPRGHYCQAGTGEPPGCPAGTYSNSLENKAESDCLNCPAGEYCAGVGNSIPDGNCTAGFFCPERSDSGSMEICEANHYCEGGAKNQSVCPKGTYQPLGGQDKCENCQSGHLCDPTDGVLGLKECPMGFYCPSPAGAVYPEPCPAGTYSDANDLSSALGCLMCPPGKYCLQGSSTPTDNCHPKHYCTGGATEPEPYYHNVTDILTGNSVCPPGYYCEGNGTAAQMCPAGTYNENNRSSSVLECLACPPGKFCPIGGLSDSSALSDCDPGFVCVGGAISAKPNDLTGYPCPAGRHCPRGSGYPLACLPGTYSTEGLDECIPCEAGRVCPDTNMTATLPCTIGHYCLANTSIPEPCPISTYNDAEECDSEMCCKSCKPGYFCNDTGLTDVAGPCYAGYLCNGKSSSPAPDGTGNGTLYNGPCPVGRYCLEAALGASECPIGTFRSVPGAASIDECTACTPGEFCATTGLNATSGECDCGYFCPGNSTTRTDQTCAIGHSCPVGASQSRPCAIGSYQPNPGQCDCVPCRAGYYCKDATLGGEVECPSFSYCPEGTPDPIPCPNGTFTAENETGLATDEECNDCPPGKFCTGGRIKGDCNAGYFCVSRAYSPTGNTTNLEPCPSKETCVDLCPAGHYCHEGVEIPTPCPENTLREQPGASNISGCMFCPAGKWCHEGVPVPDECPMGQYCVGLKNTSDCANGAGPQPCPQYTFMNRTGASLREDCMACPAGFWCNDTGLSDYRGSECALGYYCEGAGQAPVKCPGGTLRDTVGAESVNECQLCTPGYYCPDTIGTDTVNINGIPCDKGYVCPEGSKDQTPCTVGYYCLERTSVPEECPAGYYCPEGSFSFTQCDYPYYCPNGTGDPLPCDIGFQPLNISGLRSSLDVACMICPVGSYRNSSTDDKCLPCPPGYFCPAGTGNFQKNPCPNGHYCPEGGITSVGGVTGAPIPCPAGTYGAQAGSEFSVCQPCAAGMYNNLEGQTACVTCGSFAVSTGNAIACTCMGFNRAFQASDGSCVCMSGYVYYNEANQLQSDGNSQYSCQPMVDQRCGSSQARTSDDRACIDPATVDCTQTCSASGGEGAFNVDLGLCICATVTFPEEIACSSGCNQVSTNLDTSTGVLTVSVTSSTDNSVTQITVPNVFGPTSKISSTADTTMLTLSPSGIFGVLPTSAEVMNSVVDGSMQDQISAAFPATASNRRRRSVLTDEGEQISSYFGRKLLQSTNGSFTTTATAAVAIPPVIASPVICLQLNQMVIFGITLNQNNRALSNYPVYVRDHLYNSNPSFDFGAFRQLQEYVTQSNFTVTNFAHYFTESGTFVFADAQNPQHQTVISVLDNSLQCATGSNIQPTTVLTLTQLGVAKQPVSNLEPDWVLIGVLLGLFALCVLVLVIAIIVWRPRNAGIYPMRYWKPRWRAVGESYVPPEKGPVAVTPNSSMGLGLIRQRGEAEGAEDDVKKDVQLLEDFNVRTLYDKLEDQNLHLSSQLDKHQNSLQGFYEKISGQTEGLKKMLDKLDVSELEKAERMRSSSVVEGPTVVNTSLQMDGLDRDMRLAGGSSLKEKELLRSLEMLISKLNSGKITVSDEVIEDAKRRLQGLEGKSYASGADANKKKNGSVMDEWKAQGQEDLVRAQQSDKIDLDRELLAGEREAMSGLLISHDNQRQNVIKELNDKLAFRMQGDLSDKEMNALLAEHEKELDKALGAFGRERQRQMSELKEQLAAKRRERAEQLKREHGKQSKDAGLPVVDEEDDSSSDENLATLEKQLEAAILEESALASKEESDALRANDEGVKLSKTFDDELNAMVTSGLITDDVREQMKRQIMEQEQALQDRMERSREMQIKALRDRMAERKKKRMKKLEKKHDEERAQVDEVTPEMQLRQSSERDALSAELDAEEMAMERNVIEAVQSEHEEALKELHHEVINEMGEKHGVDPVAQQELLERYRREADNFDEVNRLRRDKQAQDFKAKLAAKRARRAADVQKSNEDRMKGAKRDEEQKRLEELAKLQAEEEAKRKHDEQFGGLDIPEVQVADNLEVQALVREQSRLLNETEQQQASEVEKLATDLEKKEKVEEEALERRLAEESEKALRETKAKQEAEARARTDLSDEQVQQLLAAHQQELDEMELALGKQQNRQRAALREKLAARRTRKTAALRSRQELEKEREQVEQRREMAQVQAKTMKEAERDAILEGIEKNGSTASEKIIQKVLEKRQAQELKDLEKEFELKKRLLIEEALKAIKDHYQAERDAMLQRHEAELQRLEDEGLSPEELAKRKAELAEQHKRQLSSLDKKHKKACKEIELATTAEWKLEFSQAKLGLKEKHYQEFAEALRELAPSATQQKSAAEADKSVKRLEAVKEQLEQERDATEKKFAQERLDLEEEERRRIAEALGEFEKQLEEETELEKMKGEKTLATLAKRKDKLLKEKRQNMKEELERAAAAGASEEEQKRILDQHEKDVENLTNKMDQERIRMQSKLQERMKKMRKEKIAAKKQELKDEGDANKKDFENKQKSEMQKVQEKQIQEIQEAAEVMDGEAKRVQDQAIPHLPQKQPEDLLQRDALQETTYPAVTFDPNVQMVPYAGPTVPSMSEDDVHKMLVSSPLFHTLQEIREVLVDEKQAGGGSTSVFTGPDVNSTDGDLIPTPLAELSVRELVAYKFGTFILTLLRSRRPSHPPVSLLVAERVPGRPDLKTNAFRGSFCFDEGNGILYVKRERLHTDSVGRLSLLLVHTMAHIACGDLEADSSAKFVEEFYQCLAALSDDLFFARYKGDAGEFGKGDKQPSKPELTKDVLDVKLPDRETGDEGRSFHKRAVDERLAKYAQTAVSSTVRQEIGNIESKVTKAKGDGTLDEIDKKLATLAPATPSTSQSIRRPDTRSSIYPESGDADALNTEFVTLSREAGDLHTRLSSRDGDEVTVRNRLNNVQIRLSEVQRRLRTPQ